MSKASPGDLARARQSRLLSSLPDALVRRVLQRAVAIAPERGDVLFERGESADSFYFVLEGWVKLYRMTPGGAETVIAALTEGESFAEPPAITGDTYPVSAEAATDARLLQIPVAGLLEEMRGNPDLGFAVIASSFRFLQRLIARLHMAQAQTAPQRLAVFLADLVSDRAADGRCEVRLPHRKSLLAARLGMTPESLSRSFASLRRHGVRVSGGKARIEDVKALRTIARGERGGTD